MFNKNRIKDRFFSQTQGIGLIWTNANICNIHIYSWADVVINLHCHLCPVTEETAGKLSSVQPSVLQMLNITWVEYCCNLSLFSQTQMPAVRAQIWHTESQNSKAQNKAHRNKWGHLERCERALERSWLKISFLMNRRETSLCSLFSFRTLLNCVHFLLLLLFTCRALLSFLGARHAND